MTPRQLVLPVLGLLTFLALASAALAAAPLRATARAARSTVQVGEPVRITLHVTDSEEVPQIDAPAVEGMSIRSTGTAEVKPSVLRNVRPLSTGRVPASKLIESLRDLSKHLGDVSGGMPTADPRLTQQYQAMLKQRLGNLNRSDYDIVYLATPEKVGPITVPSFAVHANDRTVRTQPLQLFVTEARPSPWVKAALSLSNSEPSVGETVNLYVDLLVRRPMHQLLRSKADLRSQPINHVTLNVPELEGYKEIQPLQPLEKYVAKRRLPPGQLGYHINDYPGVILLEQEPASSVGPASRRSSEGLDPQWYRRRLTIPFRVVQAGEMELPPLRVGGEVYVPSGGKNRYAWEGFVASSAPLKFRILDGANRPNDPIADRRDAGPTAEQDRQDAGPTAEQDRQDAGPTAEQDRQDAGPIAEQDRRDAGPTAGLVKHSFPRAAAFVAVLAAVLVLAGVAVGLRRRRAARDPHAARLRQQRQVIGQARQRLRTPPYTAADVSAAVQDFLRARLDMAPGEITPEEAAERLTRAGYPVDLGQACAEVLRACATRQFAPEQMPCHADDLAEDADRILTTVLATQSKHATPSPAPVDELTRERLAALAD